MNIEKDVRNLAIIYVGSYIIGWLLSNLATANPTGLMTGFNLIKIVVPDPNEEALWIFIKYLTYTGLYFSPRLL
jgi:hypothetical protein